jgi:hypothetical protein
MAKALHIVGALIVSLILSGIFHWIGWDWIGWPISIVFGIYACAILFSPRTNPVPLSRAANDRYDAYIVDCGLTGKKPSWKEDDDIWIPKLPYPIEVMAAFRRLIGAMRNYAMRERNLARFKKLEAEAEGFAKACQTSSSLVAEKVLDDLIFRACPNLPSRDKSTLHSVVGRAAAKEGMKPINLICSEHHHVADKFAHGEPAL